MPENPAQARVCLSMIVKNEARVIARCLASVAPLLTDWVVVDTGSTDGTQDIVREALRSLPGQLHERPWRDFATNRNEALELAADRGEYVLVVDADDVIELEKAFKLPALTADAYELVISDAGTSYRRKHLFRSGRGFRYVGVLHEVLVGPEPHTTALLEGAIYRRTSDGARSADPDKFRKDAAALEQALEKEPDNARYVFYLAQSWRDAREHERALAAYLRRVDLGGWEEEVWYSLYEVGRLSAWLGRPEADVIAAMLRAFERRPARAEPLCFLAAYLRERGRPKAAYPFAKIASELPRPQDLLFIDDAVYAWRALDELAVAAYWTDHHHEALSAGERLLSSGKLPATEEARVRNNMAFSRAKLAGAR